MKKTNVDEKLKERIKRRKLRQQKLKDKTITLKDLNKTAEDDFNVDNNFENYDKEFYF